MLASLDPFPTSRTSQMWLVIPPQSSIPGKRKVSSCWKLTWWVRSILTWERYPVLRISCDVFLRHITKVTPETTFLNWRRSQSPETPNVPRANVPLTSCILTATILPFSISILIDFQDSHFRDVCLHCTTVFSHLSVPAFICQIDLFIPKLHGEGRAVIQVPSPSQPIKQRHFTI